MTRPRHPNKHIEEAIRGAEKSGWTVRSSKGHLWGMLYCPLQDRDGCRVRVFSTPRNPQDHAKWITKQVKLCDHG